MSRTWLSFSFAQKLHFIVGILILCVTASVLVLLSPWLLIGLLLAMLFWQRFQRLIGWRDRLMNPLL